MEKEFLIDKMAQAMYEQQVATMKADIDKISVCFSDMEDIFLRLKDETETAKILVFSSYLEDKFSLLIRSNLVNLDDSRRGLPLFNGSGPLSTFSNRILISYHLGWLTTDTKTKIDAFRKIRNEFAHNAYKISFSDSHIADRFKIIDYDVQNFVEMLRQNCQAKFDYDILIESNKISQEQYNFCTLAILATRIFQDLIVLPRAIAHSVSANSIIRDGFDSAPRLLQDLQRVLASIILNICGKDDYVKKTTTAPA